MKTGTLHPVTDYIQELFNFTVSTEGFVSLPYFDTANPRRATIGYGFNIEVPDYLLLVLYQMGIVNGTMTTTQINTIRSAFTTAINNTPHTGNTVTINGQLRTNLDQIARQYGVTSGFAVNTTQGYNIFREIVVGLNDGNIIVQGKEARLDALLQGTLAHNSKEYVAVMSLFYNSESLVDSKKKLLANAIINDNRAEAWYEIRYNSNADGQHADRRYREADLFGLYDSGTLTADEQTAQAKEIMRMYTIHELQETNPSKKMSAYESKYTAKPAKTIVQEIAQARDYLVNNFAMGNTIDGEVVVGKGLITYDYSLYDNGNYNDNNLESNYSAVRNDLIFGEKGNDQLYGFAGNDVIYGGEGDDMLIGGIGNDTLIGGENDDTYIINAGEGEDTIEDKQGNNKVILCDKQINFFYDTGDGRYKSPDGTLEGVMVGTDLVVTHEPTGTTVRLNENFQWGDFGTTLITLPANPNIVDPPILGDLTPVDMDPGQPGIQYGYDQWGNVIIDPSQPDPGREDHIYDTFGNDLIEGGAGDDLIDTVRGGDDRIKGGDGGDIIAFPVSFGGARQVLTNSIIEGGTGSDIILGHYTINNQLFGDNYGDMETLIAAGELAPDSGERGDFLSDYYLYGSGQQSSTGYIYGSNGRDILINNVGKGLIVGGGGDDLIYGVVPWGQS